MPFRVQYVPRQFTRLLSCHPPLRYSQKAQHKHFNNLLNDLATSNTSASPFTYTHKHLVDSFYASDTHDKDRIRVTRDEKTSTVIECTRKVRLGDLNIYSPKRAADWRISVNLEVPGLSVSFLPRMIKTLTSFYYTVPHPTGLVTHRRKKDRVSYSHEEFNIDLTQVTSSTTPNAPVCIVRFQSLRSVSMFPFSMKFLTNWRSRSLVHRSFSRRLLNVATSMSQNLREMLLMSLLGRLLITLGYSCETQNYCSFSWLFTYISVVSVHGNVSLCSL